MTAVTDSRPLLSVFPGIDLFGRAFEAEGFCVLRGPDKILGHDIRGFHIPRGVVQGVIGGSPCQDFSRARRSPPSGYGVEMLAEFGRVVTEAAPDWFVLENVPGIPDIQVPGYKVQRFNLNAKECGAKQNRLRCFQFGSLDGKPLVIHRGTSTSRVSRCCMATEGQKKHRRTWSEFCQLQGLPHDFDLPDFTKAGKYKVVGNGVPLAMGRVVAVAIRRRPVTPWQRVCVCNCGQPVFGKATMATAACRKRMERVRRDMPGSVTSRPVTLPDMSL